MMAEGALRVVPGAPVSVSLRNIGWVDGAVAWVQDSRFGIAFRQEVDARHRGREQHSALCPPGAA